MARDLNAIYIAGPGHGGPGLVANSYLEGSYTETYPHITHDTEGLHRLFRQFAFPCGIPSHVAPTLAGHQPYFVEGDGQATIHLREEGTTTTPFDMLMLNDLDRFHLVIDVIDVVDRVPGLASRAAFLRQEMADERLRHRAYTREYGEDMPDGRGWQVPEDDAPA